MPEERRSVAVNVDVRVDMLVVITRVGTSRWCRSVGPWPRGVLAVLLPLVVPSTALFPHLDLLWVRLRVAWPPLPEFSMEVDQLLIELAPGLNKLVEARLALGIRGAVAQCRFHVGGAA
jgi:hypothetical protein